MSGWVSGCVGAWVYKGASSRESATLARKGEGRESPERHARQLSVYFLPSLNLKLRNIRNTRKIYKTYREYVCHVCHMFAHELTPMHCNRKTIHHKEHKEHKDFIATKRHKRHKIVSIFAWLIVKAADIAAYMQAYRSKSRHLHIQPVGLCSLFR